MTNIHNYISLDQRNKVTNKEMVTMIEITDLFIGHMNVNQNQGTISGSYHNIPLPKHNASLSFK